MNKENKAGLIHALERLAACKGTNKITQITFFIEDEQWSKFMACCFFQDITPVDALKNYMVSASPSQIIEHARKQMGGKEA